LELDESLVDGPHALLARLVGRYEGRAKLWMEPGKLEDDEPVTGEIVPLLGGRFVQHTYTTRIGGDEESGLALVGCKLDEPRWQVSWIDSWHTAGEIMQPSGPYLSGAAEVDVSTTYAGEWNWCTTFTPGDGDDGTVLVRHYNSGPEHPEYLCVELSYQRLA
jgi:hypothetical protein